MRRHRRRARNFKLICRALGFSALDGCAAYLILGPGMRPEFVGRADRAWVRPEADGDRCLSMRRRGQLATYPNAKSSLVPLTLAALEPRLTLLDECSHPLEMVLGCSRGCEGLSFSMGLFIP